MPDPAPGKPIREHFLVVDDDPTMLAVLVLLLTAEGHQTSPASSGEEALTTLTHPESNSPPTVLLVDLQLPGLRGAALAARLREHLSPSAILLGMSGSPAPVADRTAFDSFLLKPFKPRDLHRLVERLRSAREPSPQPTALPPDKLEPLDEQTFGNLAASMPVARLRELYTLCLNDSATRLQHMHVAAEANDEPAFARQAHAIKGSSAMLGALQLTALASQMETGGLACRSLLDDFATASAVLRDILDQHLA